MTDERALVPITSYPTPFSSTATTLELPQGLTLAEMVERAIEPDWLRSHAVVQLQGMVIPRSSLKRVKSKAGPRAGAGAF